MEILIIIIFAFYWLIVSKHKGAKGSIGESIVARILNNLQNEEYRILNDVLVKKDGRSSQIDHIVVSIHGIFVIETKNYSGWIYGNDNSEYWTQTIYKYKSKFRNPVKQNWSHVYALKDVLSDFKKLKYHPIVVFVGNAELKNVFSKMPIIYGSQLSQTIMNIGKEPNLSTKQVKTIFEKLNEANLQDRHAKKEHIRQVQNHAYGDRQKKKTLTCPRCGKSLVMRDGSYGNFYGCSSYPNFR